MRLAPVRELWSEYLAARLVNPNKPVNALVDLTENADTAAVRPLESAVMGGNVEALRACLEAGADISRVPSRNWGTTQKLRDKHGFINDIFDFVWAWVTTSARTMGAGLLPGQNTLPGEASGRIPFTTLR